MSVNDLVHIITLCCKNDRIAQEKLYRAFFGLFLTIAKNYTTDKEALLSIINEAFLKIFTHIQDFDSSKGSFETWSKTILQRVCIDHYRKSKNIVDTTEITEYISNAIHQADPQGYPQDMEYYFNLLPTVTGKVCRMFLLHGFSHKEIGGSLGISENTSKWHLSEGRKRLQELLKTKYA